MKIILLTVTAVLMSSTTFAQTNSAPTINVTAETVPGEFMVRFKGQYGDQKMTKGMSRLHGRARIRHSLPGINLHHMKLTNGEAEGDVINELSADPNVAYAEPVYVVHLNQTDADDGQILSAGDAQIMSSGTGSSSYSQSTAPVEVTQSWASMTGSGKVIVAVIDTGMDYTHYVMTGTVTPWSNTHEIANNGIDDDGNGFVDDVQGWNFAYSTNNPMDDNGHGTHVAGIITGVAQNIFASSLATSKIQIMSLKFMDSSGSGTTANAVAAIYYAIANGAKVINNSWGGSGYTQSLNDALNYAYNHGVFIASAAGNYSGNDDSSLLFPASLTIPSMITVAATDSYDNLANFSSYGASTVHVAAPGVSILSTYPNNEFAYLSGTSMAAPFVAGLAAQVLREAPQLSGYQVKQLIMKSVDVVPALNGYVSSSGRVNALTTIQNANAAVGTAFYQPQFTEVVPQGVSTGGSNKSMGCGTISTGALSSMFWSKDGGSGGAGPGVLSSILALLMLPLFASMVVRSRLVTPMRRRYERFEMATDVKVYRDGKELSGRLATISLGGVSFSTDQSLSKGELITLQISDPSKTESIQVMGKIVWNQNDRSYGVQFGPLATSLMDKINDWTRDLASVRAS